MDTVSKDKKELLRQAGQGLLAVVKVEIFFKVATLGVTGPVMDWIFRKWVLGSELVFNADMFWKLLSPARIILFLLLFFAAGLLCYYEINTLLYVVYWSRRGKRVGTADALKSALPGMKGMKHPAAALAALYFVLLLPLVHVGYVNSLVPRIAIPNFILGEMQRTGIGRLGIFAVRAGYLALFTALLLTPVAMSLGRLDFIKGVKKNFCWYRNLVWKDRGKIWAAFAGWLILDDQIILHMQQKLMQNQDFNVAFLRYFVRSKAYREGVGQWILFNCMQCVGIVLIFWLVLGILEKYEQFSVPEPAVVDTQPLKQAVMSAVGKGGVIRETGRRFWRKRKHKRLWALGIAVVLFFGVSQYFQTYPLVHEPWVIGHRGCIYEVENSINSVEKAGDRGADYAEIDVQLSKDGVPVVIHDENLWRLAGEFSTVGDLTAAQLKALTITSGGKKDRIPTLEEMIAAAEEFSGGVGLLIELKPVDGNNQELTEKVIRLVEEYDFGERALFMSLDYECVAMIQQAHPEWWVGYCIFGSAGAIDASVWDYDIDFLAVEENRVSNHFMEQARRQWLPVYIWTVDDVTDMRIYLEMGASGIITDVPDEAREAVEQFKENNQEYYVYDGTGYPRDEEVG